MNSYFPFLMETTMQLSGIGDSISDIVSVVGTVWKVWIHMMEINMNSYFGQILGNIWILMIEMNMNSYFWKMIWIHRIKWRYELNGGDGGKLYWCLAMTDGQANSTSTHAGIWSANDRWLGLIVQVRTKLCGHKKNRVCIRVGRIVWKWPQIKHNSTTAQAKTEQKITMY